MKRTSFFRFVRTLTAMLLAFMMPFNAFAGALTVAAETVVTEVREAEVEPVITLPAALEEVSAQMFMGNQAVEEVILQDGMLTIGEQAFADCTKLVRIEIPASVILIEDNAFENALPELFIDAPADSYAAQWARDHGIATNEPEAVLEAAFEHYYPTLYLQGNLDGVVVGFAQAEYPLAEGENIEWQLDKVSGSDVANLYINQTSENGRFAWVYADSVHATGSSEWRLTALAPDGQEWSTEFTTTVKTLPENLPTELIIDEPIKVDVGERFEFNPSQLVSCNGVIPETDNWNHYGLQVYYELVNDPTYEQIEDGDNGAFAFTPATDGRYGVLVTLYLGNHAITREAILWVGTGVSSTAYLHVTENDPLYISESKHFWIGNVELMRFPLLEGEEAVVTAELLESAGEEAAITFHFAKDDDVSPVFWNMVADGFSGEVGTDVYRIRVAVGESVFTYDYEIEVREVTENMPTGITVPQTYYEVEIGDTLTLYNDDIQFVDGQVPEDASVETGYWSTTQILRDQEVNDDLDGISIHFVQNGTYEIEAVKAVGGLEYRLPITIKVGTGISDAAHILAQQYLHTVFLGAENEDIWVGCFDVQEYELHENEEYYWALEMISDPETAPVKLYISDGYENWRGVNLFYTDLTGETGSVTYRLSVQTTEGLERSVEVTLTVVDGVDQLPTGITVPQTSYELSVGDTLTLKYSDIGFTGGQIPDGVESRVDYWELDSVPSCEWVEDGVALTFDQNGRYQVTAVACIANVLYTLPISITVGTGVADDVSITERVLFATQYINMNGGNWVGDGNLNNYVVLDGEELSWKIERIDGNSCDPGTVEVDFVWDNGLCFGMHIHDFTGETGATTWRLTVESTTGFSLSKDYEIEFVEKPESAASGVSVPAEVVYLDVNETYEVNRSDVRFEQGEVPADAYAFFEVYPGPNWHEVATLEDTEDGYSVTFHQEGTYWYSVCATINGNEYSRDVTIVVGEPANESVEFSHYFPTLYVDGNQPEVDVAELRYAGELGEDEFINWNVEMVSGAEGVELFIGEISEDSSVAYVYARDIYAEGESLWRATAKLPDGTAWIREFTTNVVALPDTIPAELEVDLPVYVPLNERYEFRPSKLIQNLDQFPDHGNSCVCNVSYYIEIWEDPTHEHIDDGRFGAFAFTPTVSDRYGFSLYYYIGNHVVEHHGILFVGDGTTTRDVLVEQLKPSIYADGNENAWLGNLLITRYHLLPGEEASWNIEMIESSGETPVAEVSAHVFEDTTGMDLHLESLSGEAGTVTYRITAEVGGNEFTYDYVLTVETLPENMPTAIAMDPTSYELNVGDSLTLTYDMFDAEGGIPDGVEAEKQFHVDDSQFHVEWTEEGITATFDANGRYQIYAAIEMGNYVIKQPIIITVGTGIPENAAIVENLFFGTQYVNMDNTNWVGEMYLEGYDPIEGETLKWTLERVDENDCDPADVFIEYQSDDGRWAGIRADGFTGETGPTTWRLSLESSLGLSLSKEYEIEFVDMPDSLPTIAYPEPVVYLDVGETYTLFSSDITFEGEIDENADMFAEMHVGHLEEYADLTWLDEGFEAVFRQDGRYSYTVFAVINGCQLFEEICLVVGDGIPDDARVEYVGTERTAYTNSEYQIWGFEAHLNDYVSLPDETFAWTLEQVSEGEPVAEVRCSYDDGMGICYDLLPTGGETGTVVYRLTLETSTGFTSSQDITIQVIDRPDTLPTDLTVTATEYQLAVGETFTFSEEDVSFADGSVSESDWTILHFDRLWEGIEEQESFRWMEDMNGFEVSFPQDGRYGFEVHYWINNMLLAKPITLVVGTGIPADAKLNVDQVMYTAYYGADYNAYVGNVGVDGYALLSGEAYEWSIELIDAPEQNQPVTLKLSDEYDNGNGINIHASDINQGTGSVTYRIRFTTENGLDLSTDITIDVVDLPEDLPTALSAPATEYAFNVGDSFELLYDAITAADGVIPENNVAQKEYWMLESIPGCEWMENGLRFTFECEGTYFGYSVLRLGNYIVRQPIMIKVGDGVKGDAMFTFHQKYSKLYCDIENWTDHIGWFLLDYVDEQCYWELEHVSGPWLMDLYIQNRRDFNNEAWVFVGGMSGETGVATYCLKVSTDSGLQYSHMFDIEVTECPEGLPTEVIAPQTEFHFEIGETYDFLNEVLELGEGTVPEDAHIVKEYAGLHEIPGAEVIYETDAIDGDGWRVTFDRNGRYLFNAVIKIESYTLQLPCTITVGTGYSDDTCVDWVQDLHVIYTDLPEYSTWIGCAYLNNYNVLNDEDVTWTLERVDGGENNPVELYYTFETGYVEEPHLRYTNIQSTGTVTYRLTVNTEAGFTDSHDYTVTVEPLPDDLPTDINVQTYYEIAVGEMFVFDATTASFADGTVPENASFRYHVNGGDFEWFMGNESFEWLDNGFQVSFDREGRYVFGFGMQLGNYTLRKDIVIAVGEGLREDVHMELWSPMSPIYAGTDYTWYGNAYLYNFRLAEGETINWSLLQQDENTNQALTMYTMENDPYMVSFDVQESAVAGDYAYVVEAALPTGDILQQEMKLQIQELPDDLPTELVTTENYTVNVGDDLVIMHADIAFGEGNIPDGATINTQIWTDGALEQTSEQNWVVTGDNEEGLMIRPYESGVYTITVAKFIGNYRLTKDISLVVVDPEAWKIAILTGSENQGAEEYTAAQMAAARYGSDRVITDTYADDFITQTSATTEQILAFAQDPNVRAIIVEQAVAGTYSAFRQLSQERSDLLLISGVPSGDLAMQSAVADIVLYSDEGAQAGPIVDKCAEWGVDVFVHLSFPRHLAMTEVAERHDLIKSKAEANGITFVDVTIPDPTADEGLEYSCNYLAEQVAEYAEQYADQKVAFFSTVCGVQAALQSAVLSFENAYYPAPCCPGPFHGFGESLGLDLELNNPSGALRQIANALNASGAAGRFSTWAAPVNMGILEVAAQYAAAYAQGHVQDTNDSAFLGGLLEDAFSGASISNADYDNAYSILLAPVDFTQYTGEEPVAKIAILTGSESQGAEECAAARQAAALYGEDRVLLDTYADNFTEEVEATTAQILAFAEDPEVKAIIVSQSVPGTLDAFQQISESRDDVLLISGMPQEDISAMNAAADVVMLTDEAAHAAPIMNKCEEWGIEVFVHYSFERHLALSGVANRLAAIKAKAETLGIEVVEVEMPDPVTDGLETARSFILEDVPVQTAAYADKKVAFFATNCGVQASLQSAVLGQANAYYPQPCCPSPFHGFGESLGLELDLRNPGGALTAIANKLSESGAAGRFSTWPVPVNMGIVEIAADFAMVYANGETEKDNKTIIPEMFDARFDNVSLSLDSNTYTIMLGPVSFEDYVVDENTTISLWVAENSVEFTQEQVNTFMAANEQYADLSVRIESVGEGDAADRVLASDEELVDMFVFAQDQLARLVTAGRLSEVSDENAAVIAQENDDGSVNAVQVGDTTYAYPVTSDNGYFLYYDSSVVTDPSSLESIIASCEAADKGVLMEVNSGWYQPAFFFGAGCTLTYDVDSEGNFVSCNVDYASENGVRALKAMMSLTGSESFENLSDTSSAKGIGAVVSGTWLAQAVQEALGSNYAAVKLPTVDGFQMGGFGGFKMLGVRPQPNEHKQEACEALAMYLTSEEVQSARFDALQWGPSNLNAQQTEAVQNNVALAALADQLQYCVPQGQYPDKYWTLANEFGDRVIDGEFDGMTDEELLEVLAEFQAAAIAIVAGEEPIRLRWAMGTGVGAPADNEMVLEELNAMSRELIGVECEIEYYTEAELRAAIAMGEEIDIMFTCDWFNNTDSLMNNGLLLDVADVIEIVAPDMYASMDEKVWQLAKTGGSLYAIPVKKDYAAMHFLTYPSDMADELGFDIPDEIAAWSELTPFLEAWKATMPEDEYPVLIGGAARSLESTFDFIDSTAMIGCVYGTSDVVTVFDDPEVMERYRTLADWYSKGLINPDAPNITESELDTSKQRIRMVQAWPGYDYSAAFGYNTEMAGYTKAMLSRAGVWGAMNALSCHLADDPDRRDAALKYLELCYTNQLFMDTMRYGVQGYHWNYVTEEESEACAGGVLRTSAGSSNYAPWAFSQPAYFSTSIAVSEDQVNGTAKAPNMNQYDLYDQAIAENGVVSALGAFKWDSSAWESQLAEMTAIKDEYYANFATGAVSIDDVYDEYMAKMNAAGLQEMIADAQAQLDAYLGK